jgi:hypothetical protein
MTVNVQNIKYLPTLPLNTQMTGMMADNGSGIHFSCDLQLPKAAAKRLVYRQLKTTSTPLSIGGQHVFPSALDGMDTRWASSAAAAPFALLMAAMRPVMGNP